MFVVDHSCATSNRCIHAKKKQRCGGGERRGSCPLLLLRLLLLLLVLLAASTAIATATAAATATVSSHTPEVYAATAIATATVSPHTNRGLLQSHPRTVFHAPPNRPILRGQQRRRPRRSTGIAKGPAETKKRRHGMRVSVTARLTRAARHHPAALPRAPSLGSTAIFFRCFLPSRQ